MANDTDPVIALDNLLRDPANWVGREVRVRGTLRASSTETNLVSPAGAISIELGTGNLVPILIRGGVAPYVGGPFLYDHDVVVSAVCCRHEEGGLSLRQIRQVTVNPGNAALERVLEFS